MSREANPASDAHRVTVTIPLAIRKQGGRKHVVMPDGAPGWARPIPRADGTLVKILARAFRWRRLLEEGVYASCAELAAAEKINASYVSRVLRLTLLAPEIVEAILDGQQPASLELPRLLSPFPLDWLDQRRAPGLRPSPG